MSQVRSGQVVGFVYNKGTNPGNHRLVEVTDVDSGHIKGNDLNLPENDRFRNFSLSEIKDGQIEVIAQPHEEFIPLTNVISTDVSHLDHAQIAGLYSLLCPNRQMVGYYPNYKGFVVKRQNSPHVEFTVEGTRTKVEFINSEGQYLGLTFDHADQGSSLSLPFNMKCRMAGDDLYDFATKLVKHFETSTGWANHVTTGHPIFAGSGTQG